MGGAPLSGGRRGSSIKTLKKILKKAGLKTSGRKAALTRRAKKAHLKLGGANEDEVEAGAPAEAAKDGGRRRRSRKSRARFFA